MICTQEKGHKGPCTAGSASGGCKKTAAKWFEAANDPRNVDDNPHPDALSEPDQGGSAIRGGEEPHDGRAASAGGPTPGSESEIEGITAEEMAGSSEQQLAMLYRRHMHPCSRQEAVEWARGVVAARDLGAGA